MDEFSIGCSYRLLLAFDVSLAGLGQDVAVALPRDAAVAPVTLVLFGNLQRRHTCSKTLHNGELVQP